MTSWRDRVDTTGANATLRAGGVAIDEVIRRLESTSDPSALGIEPLDVVAALAWDALGAGDGPELEQTSPARPALASALTESALHGLWPGASRARLLALSAGLLQIQDFWDASHQAAQKADDLGEGAVSAYWHGIAHRREPDPGNASYWFRRVGRHSVFGPLAEQARGLLAIADPAVTSRLLGRGGWDPHAFIDVCCDRRGTHARLARAIQKVEMSLLLDASLST